MNRFRSKLELQYENNDNAIKLTAGNQNYKRGNRTTSQKGRDFADDDGDDFDKIFGAKDFARFSSEEEDQENGTRGEKIGLDSDNDIKQSSLG